MLAMYRLGPDPLWMEHLVPFVTILLTVPIIAWFCIRWNRWFRAFGLVIVGLSTLISMKIITDAIAGGAYLYRDGADFIFLSLAFLTLAVPVVTARLAFVWPKKGNQRPGTPGSVPSSSTEPEARRP
jgi:hypothetical protein